MTKIHKDGNPLRVIVSSVNSPLYYFSLFLHNLISDSIPKAPSYIRDSLHGLVKHLNGTVFDPEYVLASLDVISLFTNIPIELALNSIDRR